MTSQPDQLTRAAVITDAELAALRAVTTLTTAGVENVQRAWSAIDKLERRAASDEKERRR